MIATVNGYLKNVPVDKVPEYETGLFRFLDQKYDELMQIIRETGNLPDEDALAAAIGAWPAEFLKTL